MALGSRPQLAPTPEPSAQALNKDSHRRPQRAHFMLLSVKCGRSARYGRGKFENSRDVFF